MSAVTVPVAYKKLVTGLSHMFYSGQCPPSWWVDAADPKKPDSSAADELGLFEEKKAAQLAREAKRKQQASMAWGINCAAAAEPRASPRQCIIGLANNFVLAMMDSSQIWGNRASFFAVQCVALFGLLLCSLTPVLASAARHQGLGNSAAGCNG
jgi:hypothetical protein